jgi:signal transduction histidine kinase
MNGQFNALLRSMPFRLTLGLVALFAVVSLLSFAASYLVTERSITETMRADLRQDMAGFRAAPNATALAALVEAEARDSDPKRIVLNYTSRFGRSFGNSAIARDADGYHLVSLEQGNPRLTGEYLALTDTLWGGQLTIARSRQEIHALRDVFWNILGLSLIPTFAIGLSGGLWFARSSARQVEEIGTALDALTTGNLSARVAPSHGWTADLAGIGNKVDQMAASQEASITAIKQVSSDIAHDLKTPLQRVAVHLDDLDRQDGLSEATRKLVENATAEVDGMAAIFRSLLQIAQIESGAPNVQFHAVDLRNLAETFCEIYEPTATDAGKTLTCKLQDNTEFLVSGDRTLLGQVLANLIENAIRHTPKGASIAVSVLQDDTNVTLSVVDDGQGIPQSERDLVLRRLYRLDRSRTTPGSGLGLSLVSSIVTLHNAHLTLLDNAPGLSVSIAFPKTGASAQKANA